jgi:hypothetical protein
MSFGGEPGEDASSAAADLQDEAPRPKHFPLLQCGDDFAAAARRSARRSGKFLPLNRLKRQAECYRRVHFQLIKKFGIAN